MLDLQLAVITGLDFHLYILRFIYRNGRQGAQLLCHYLDQFPGTLGGCCRDLIQLIALGLYVLAQTFQVIGFGHHQVGFVSRYDHGAVT